MESELDQYKANYDDDKLHIAMFPWLAFGHMLPFLELAKLIAQKGHKISFISTPRNADRLPKLPPHLSNFITFVKLPLPCIENLPESAEATSDLPVDDVWLLKKAYDFLQEPLSKFLQSSLPDWILFDYASYWLPDIAHKLNIRTVYFCVFRPSSLCYIGSGDEEYRTSIQDCTVPPKWISFPTTVSYRLFEALKIFGGTLSEYESNITDFHRCQKSIKCCDLVAIRSCLQFEPEWLGLTEQIFKRPVLPIGVLPREADQEDDAEHWHPIKKWLDSQEKRSVVYIAFGSEAIPSQEDVTEIALGLELSGLPFLWAFRKSRGLSADEQVLELPNGFEDRVKERGKVCTGWVPQIRILGHESVGGFLFHSGWSSTVEALQNEIALVVLAYHSDQALNAKALQDKNIGYLIPRNEEDGSFKRNSVAESLRLVLVEEEGKIYREKSREMSALFRDKDRQSHYVDNFLDYLKAHNKYLKNGEGAK